MSYEPRAKTTTSYEQNTRCNLPVVSDHLNCKRCRPERSDAVRERALHRRVEGPLFDRSWVLLTARSSWLIAKPFLRMPSKLN